MNELRSTYNGGMPLRLDDVRWIVAGLKDAIKGLSTPFLSPNGAVILSGCVATDLGSGNYSYSAGYVYFDNEVFYFPAIASIAISDINASFYMVETFDATGTKVYEDATTHDTYAIRVAGIGAKATYPAYEYLITKRIEDNIALKMNVPLVWNNLTGGTAPSGGSNLQYCKDIIGFVRMKGQYLNVYSPTTTLFIGILPVGFRPVELQTSYIPVSGSAGLVLIKVVIDTSGNIYVYPNSTTPMSDFWAINIPAFKAS